MTIMASSIARGRVRTTAVTVTATVEYGGPTPNNRLIETYSLALPCASLILDIHVMIN